MIETCQHETKIRIIKWNRPPNNIHKLNTDGRERILRDSNGNKVYAFTIPLGIGTNYQAETQATTHGIYWFVQHGYERIIFVHLLPPADPTHDPEIEYQHPRFIRKNPNSQKDSLSRQFLLTKYCQRANPVEKKGILGRVLVAKYMMRNKAQMEADNTGFQMRTLGNSITMRFFLIHLPWNLSNKNKTRTSSTISVGTNTSLSSSLPMRRLALLELALLAIPIASDLGWTILIIFLSMVILPITFGDFLQPARCPAKYGGKQSNIARVKFMILKDLNHIVITGFALYSSA
ncbi:hypothetical protein H5410_061940 [Solanum commersonii]|uniref:Uncharacterized protein n=1 Tax=Solanum commersonii TaxID=4109 RepID=A0A9J5WB52_SOLCO|nr:hypothetical protein H5410_061940 [Solanum commersonii]